MKPLFYKFFENIVDSFRGYNFIYHLIAIVTTYIIVVSDFDWKYFQFFRGSILYYVLFSGAVIGGLVPFIVPIAVFLSGKIRKNAEHLNISFALGQAAIIGWFISSFYKALTGRPGPEAVVGNITHIFNFGFLRGGIFWGWPSTHTTVAFAMAFTLWALYSKNKIVRTFALIYALYIGFGVSMTIHFLSDAVAGAIFGIVIGTVVGKAFKERELSF